MSESRSFGERARQTFEEAYPQLWRRYRIAVETERLTGRPLSHDERIRDARAARDLHSHQHFDPYLVRRMLARSGSLGLHVCPGCERCRQTARARGWPTLPPPRPLLFPDTVTEGV